jgi:uncharacterized protein YutE (UPF0331/DUF86 family)
VVDEEVLRGRTAHVLHHVERLRGRVGLTAAGLRGDEDLWNAVLMDLQQAIQGCIDLATHVCVDDRLGSPSSAAEAFELLGQAGRLPDALVARLAGACGLRNLIVHQYGALDADIVLSVITNDLAHLEAFLAAMRP